MATINQVYNYYLANYARTSLTRYDSHKKSELRTVCNTIAKLSKESPLYKVDFSEDMQKYIIDIKENARNIKNVVSALSDNTNNTDSGFHRKIAVSSQEDIASVTFVGKSIDVDELSSFELEVKKLATPQINLGNFLPAHKTTKLPPGTYSFDLDIGDMGYEFQFGIEKDDTNIDIQRKLSNLINESDIGLNANVLGEYGEESSLEIQSVYTGISTYNRSIFSISESNNSNSSLSGAVDYLGIDEISQYSENSSFLLNGLEKSSYANTFTISKMFEVSLHGISEEGNPLTIGFKTTEDTIVDNTQELVDAYNSTFKLAQEYSSKSNNTAKLRTDMGFVTKQLSGQLESIGLVVQENGSIQIDKNLLTDAVTDDNTKESLSILKDFKSTLYAKADKAMMNPMEYVNKTLVAYKNPGKTFSNPYITSIYSGMIFNSYC